MFNIIDRYVAKQFLAFLTGSLIVVVALFVAIDAMTTMLNLNAPLSALAAYYAYSIPAIVYQLLPVACLIATVFVLSSMNRAHELTAMFSLGTSLARASLPILILVSAMSALALLMADQLLPLLNQKKRYVEFVEIKKQPGLYSTVKKDKIWYRNQNIIFNIKTLNVEEARAEGLNLYYFDDAWNMVQKIAAQTLDIKENKWELTEGTITLFETDSSFPLTQSFKQKTLNMPTNAFDLEKSSSSSEVMSLQELKQFIKKNKDAGLDTVRYEVDYHSKISFAFAALVMTLLGIPFCAQHTRAGGAAASVGIVMLLVFSYWALYSSGLTLGNHGTLPPVLAAWGANVVGFGVALGFMLNIRK